MAQSTADINALRLAMSGFSLVFGGNDIRIDPIAGWPVSGGERLLRRKTRVLATDLGGAPYDGAFVIAAGSRGAIVASVPPSDECGRGGHRCVGAYAGPVVFAGHVLNGVVNGTVAWRRAFSGGDGSVRPVMCVRQTLALRLHCRWCRGRIYYAHQAFVLSEQLVCQQCCRQKEREVKRMVFAAAVEEASHQMKEEGGEKQQLEKKQLC